MKVLVEVRILKYGIDERDNASGKWANLQMFCIGVW
jgi:hypothetical protein